MAPFSSTTTSASGARSTMCRKSSASCGSGSDIGQAQAKHRSGCGVLDPNAAAVGLHRQPAKREAEPPTRTRGPAPAIDLNEAIENGVALVGGHTRARVGNPELEGVGAQGGAHADDALLGRVA